MRIHSHINGFGENVAIYLQCELIHVAQTLLTHHTGMNNTIALAWCYYSLIMLYPRQEFQILRKWFHLFATWQHGDSWQGEKRRQNSTHFRFMTFPSFLNLYGLVAWLIAVVLHPRLPLYFADGHPSRDDIRLSLSKKRNLNMHDAVPLIKHSSGPLRNE